jgi:energy-coupling factor transporter ATP-binding protein EcfA2
MELLRRLARQQGCAVVIVTHDSRIVAMADRLMYLEDGRLSSFAAVTSAHAAHLLTALRPVAAAGRMGELLLKMKDPEFLDLARTLTAECEQLLNVLEMGSATAARDVVGHAMRALLDRAGSRLRAAAALLWIDAAEEFRCVPGVPQKSPEAPSFLREVMHGRVPVMTDRALYIPLQNREHETFAVAEIRGDDLGEEAERTFRDYARPLGIMAQVYQQLER